jgi:general secretion pathway protein G
MSKVQSPKFDVECPQAQAADVKRWTLDIRPSTSAAGWTLIELVITMTVMAILSVGVIPLVKTAVKRQHEYELRAALRQMRESIKEFHRDTVGMQCTGIGGLGAGTGTGTGTGTGGAGGAGGTAGAGAAGGVNIDPRSKVVIADCTIFGVDNIERYPPSLDTLVQGVNVVPRTPLAGAAPDINQSPLDSKGGLLANKKKIYLRAIPKDPMTGKDDWCLHSPFDDPGTCSDNPDAGIFDVTSKADGTALDGTKYSDW